MIWARWARVMGVPVKWEIARIFVVGTGGSGFCAEAAPLGGGRVLLHYGTDLAKWAVTESPVAIGKATTKFTRMGMSCHVAPLGTVPPSRHSQTWYRGVPMSRERRAKT